MRVVIMPRTHIWPEVLPHQLERLKRAGIEDIVVVTDRQSLLREVRTADALVGEMDPEILEHAGQLKWVQALASGVDAFLFEEFIESDIVLTSEKGLVGEHLADHAFALLLGVTRMIPQAARQRNWDATMRMRMRMENRELTGKTAAIIGLGGTGLAVARRAQTFGLRCMAVDPDVTTGPDYVERVVTPDQLLNVARESDIIFVCCPKTAETTSMIGADVFEGMPADGYVINVTRGGIVDETALMAALDSGKLAGAGLDVVSEEPLPDEHPLWRYDNVLITPHTAGASQFRVDRILERVFTNMERFQRGETLDGVIDKRKGY
jgi:phosphoglycerate dehydrogenase-like enzyme